MSDNDERRPLDETGEYSPFADEEENPPIGGPPKDDRTAQLPRPGADADYTRMLPATDDDATRVTPQAPPSDATSVLPAATPDGTHTERYPRSTDNWADDGDAVWSARAGVRPQRQQYGDDFAGTDWATGPAEDPGGRWWTPIAVGIIGLVLLALLGWGIYLIVQAGEDGETTPGGPATPAAPVTTAATTEPTSAPPSPQPTTTQPTTTPPAAPSDVVVPALKGLSSDEARAALDRRGLNYRLRYMTSEFPAGTVIDSDPPEGRQVPADTVIALIIAAQPDEPTTPTQTPTTEPTGQQEED